ncbi:hypothetical protein TRICI_002041 [Trichomonascus ciferrii]|uniref:20S-pre-rRNA D-site endonuclease NOB1 n=1 Tax=Trichomonascus ciferrii TaxID=44093 RepID=A0A642V7R8_9ASCO|nr:hypothetical protein TRICI_002041 [Trichomonascus ciferrii]
MASIKSLVLDAGPLLTQSYSDIQHLAENFYTTPSVHSEIRDERARQNLLLWGDRLVIRQPKPEYVKIVSEFAKKTGDYAALSSTDIQIIALCYEVECDLNNGDWRLRKHPGQKTINAHHGKPTQQDDNQSQPQQGESSPDQTNKEPVNEEAPSQPEPTKEKAPSQPEIREADPGGLGASLQDSTPPVEEMEKLNVNDEQDDEWCVVETKKKAPKKKKNNKKKPAPAMPAPAAENVEEDDSDIDDGDGEWISADNLQETMEKDGGDRLEETAKKKIKAAMSSGDFAMQNVALQIGLNLVNPTNGMYIKKVKNYMLRCHACFKLCALPKDGRPLQFCPKCGMDTLLRCTVTVSDSGKLQVHLKKNMQWSHRGDRYSLPTPQSRNARKKRHDDNPILLREDQPEYQKAVKHDMWKKRQNEKMLDQWIGSGSADNVGSPFAISGYNRDATRHTGVRVGRGRYVNSARKK